MKHLKQYSTSIGLILFAMLYVFVASNIYAHHNAPEDLQDSITDQLLLVDSPHATTSDDDPSLLDSVTTAELDTLGLVDVDYIVVIPDISVTEVVSLVETTLEDAAINNSVCDSAFTISMEDDGTYTLTIYIDYCDF